MSKFIQTISIKGTKYKIYKTALDIRIVGLCDKTNKIIHIGANQNAENEIIPTLLHEMLHALITEVALDQVIHPDIEEIICENASRMFYEYLDFIIELKKKTRSKM